MGSTRTATVRLDVRDWTMEYEAGGLRTKRSSAEKTYNYIYNGNQLVRMTVGDDILDFTYDANGAPLTLIHNGTVYYYITNLQGDVISLETTDGMQDAHYYYDAWGKILASTGELAELNPLRYRGYVYDQETGFYYLQSRYYDPAVGRFINADSTVNTERGVSGFNMFAYCGNNPVMGYDPNGEWSLGTFVGGASLLATGVTAITVGVTIMTCGAAAPLMVAVAAITASAGTITAVCGAAEITESVTGYNVVRDGAFKSNQQEYDAYKNSARITAQVGTMVCGSYIAANGGNVCFVAGTLVLAATGAKAIEDIEAGDYVWAWDEETGDVSLKRVLETYINETNEQVHLQVNGEEIVSTPSHPFYSPVKGWTDAVRLRAGDILVLVNGEYVVVEAVQHEFLESPIAVYNFSVENYHTYYVASGVLVHNTCGNYRKNAMKYHNTDGVGKDAHHIYPQKFRDEFRQVGIDIDAPENITFLNPNIHRSGSRAYNNLWQDFFAKNDPVTRELVESAGKIFMERIYG